MPSAYLHRYPLHDQLARLGQTLSEAGASAGMLGDFVRFEMMDLPFERYPRMAESWRRNTCP